MVRVKSGTLLFAVMLGVLSICCHAAVAHDEAEMCEVCILTSHDDDLNPVADNSDDVIEQPPVRYSPVVAAHVNLDSTSAYAIRAPPVLK